jgi:hypothetical protein
MRTIVAGVLTALSVFTAACDSSLPTSAEDPLAPADPVESADLPVAASVQLVKELAGASGSAIGPGRALFVTEGASGELTRVNPKTGAVTTVASGFPPSLIGIGGATDVAFLGSTAYVLVSLVGSDVGGNAADGIYRVDGPDDLTLIADLGAWSAAHPPSTGYFLSQGVQYAIETWRGGFLVTDGHHNRVLRVTTDGDISEFATFGNIVPTGLETWGNTVYMAEAGPTPHEPEDGRVVAFRPGGSASEVASGGRLLVDVERGRGGQLYALSQGVWDGVMDGSPALPYTGSFLRVEDDGSFTVIEDAIDRPTSVEIIGNSAYIVTLGGEIRVIHGI